MQSAWNRDPTIPIFTFGTSSSSVQAVRNEHFVSSQGVECENGVDSGGLSPAVHAHAGWPGFSGMHPTNLPGTMIHRRAFVIPISDEKYAWCARSRTRLK